MQSKLQTLSGLRFTPIEIPSLRRLRTGYTNLFDSNERSCRVWRGNAPIRRLYASADIESAMQWRTLQLPQLRKLIQRHGRQFPVIALQKERVAIDLIVEVAAIVEAVAAALLLDDGADGRRHPAAKTDLDLVIDLHAVTGLEGCEGF